MAEGVLFNIAGNILNGLAPLALQELSLASNVEAELKKLKASMSMIKAVLLDAEEQHNNNNHEVTVWLRQLKGVVYDVDDLLDDLSTEALQRKTMRGNEMSKKVRIFFSKSNQLAYALKMGHRVKALRQELDAIAADRGQFHFSDRPVDSKAEIRKTRQTYSFVRIEEVIGREDDKNAIIDLLLETNCESVRVIPIVGIGGLGKTTLAQMVFNDPKVIAHFELQMWVCVSDRFEVQIVVEKMLESATQRKQENFELETLQNFLRKEIGGKKYFLVLDDVWNEDVGKWSMVKNLLFEGAKGSRVVITTRSEKVGEITSTASLPPYSYILKGLSNSKSLELFKQIAFERQIQTSNPLHPNLLETFGEKIIKLCVGVPLAIRAMGSVLRFKRGELEWARVLENISQQGIGIEPILRLSYDHLPSHLKQCFAYCSLFPKDYRIKKHVLINLWMAQGFIQPWNSGQSLEDVGHDYFMDLLWRSFFQEVEEDEFGNIKSCKMHDLMHDLAKFVAGIECSLISSLDAEKVNENTRHVSLDEKIKSNWEIQSSLLKANKMRTFFQPFHTGYGPSYASAGAIIKSFKCLRVLDLKMSWKGDLFHSICKLKHLRYLDLSRSLYICQLPNCVTRLQNLQTLDLSECWKLKKLPEGIGNMVSLRHLENEDCIGLEYMPRGLGQLTCLRTLKMFVVGREGRSRGGLRELNGLNNLCGSLRIMCLEKASTPESGAACLKEKSNLQSLSLEWDHFLGGVDDEMVLEGLRPHPNLKKLSVENYHGAKFSSWLSCITNLVQIVIINFTACRNLPPMHHLPFLKFLTLKYLDALEHVSEQDIETDLSQATTFFPSLESLDISVCRNLKGWWKKMKKEDDEEEDVESTEATSTTTEEERSLPCFPRLSTLGIRDCPNLTSFPPFPTLGNRLVLRRTNEGLLQETMKMRSCKTSSSSSSSSITLPFSNLKFLELFDVENVEYVLEQILQKCHCACLESLEISFCSELTLFPKEVHAHSLPSLRCLRINGCRNLMALPKWISNLTSLQELKIRDCAKLLQSLPQGMSHLTDRGWYDVSPDLII